MVTKKLSILLHIGGKSNDSPYMGSKLDYYPIFNSHRKEQEANRMQGVKMYKNGMSAGEIASTLGMSPRAVFRWATAFVNYGQNGLVAKVSPGRPPKFNEDQMRRIVFWVREYSSNQLSFDFGLWTLQLIGLLIERELKVKLSLPTLGKVMHTLGLSPQRSLHRAWEQDAVLVQAWRSEDLLGLLARAQRTGAQLYFVDEAGVRSDHHTGTTWGPVGCTPVVHKMGSRVSVQMLSAISMTGSMQFMIHEGMGNAEVFVRFLRQLMVGGCSTPLFWWLMGTVFTSPTWSKRT
jgi:transposase